jgi:hypothetical protein
MDFQITIRIRLNDRSFIFNQNFIPFLVNIYLFSFCIHRDFIAPPSGCSHKFVT